MNPLLTTIGDYFEANPNPSLNPDIVGGLTDISTGLDNLQRNIRLSATDRLASVQMGLSDVHKQIVGSLSDRLTNTQQAYDSVANGVVSNLTTALAPIVDNVHTTMQSAYNTDVVPPNNCYQIASKSGDKAWSIETGWVDLKDTDLLVWSNYICKQDGVYTTWPPIPGNSRSAATSSNVTQPSEGANIQPSDTVNGVSNPDGVATSTCPVWDNPDLPPDQFINALSGGPIFGNPSASGYDLRTMHFYAVWPLEGSAFSDMGQPFIQTWLPNSKPDNTQLDPTTNKIYGPFAYDYFNWPLIDNKHPDVAMCPGFHVLGYGGGGSEQPIITQQPTPSIVPSTQPSISCPPPCIQVMPCVPKIENIININKKDHKDIVDECSKPNNLEWMQTECAIAKIDQFFLNAGIDLDAISNTMSPNITLADLLNSAMQPIGVQSE